MSGGDFWPIMTLGFGGAYAKRELYDKPTRKAKKATDTMIRELKSLREPARTVRDEGEAGLMSARARARRFARGRMSTRSTWLSPSGEMKNILGG